MPSRVLREGILTSERVNSLDWEEEVFYRRLMSVVDDFGRFTAHSSLLRAALYPLKLDTVRDSDVDRLLESVERAGLVRVYVVAQKRFVELLDFRQQTRAKESKYPDPPAPAGQTDGGCTAHAQQPLTDVHLDGGGIGGGVEVVFGDGVVPPSTRAHEASAERFAMRVGWRPSQHIGSIAVNSGFVLPNPEDFEAAVAEFVAYWLTQTARKRTQHEWDHALVKHLKAERVRSQTQRSGGAHANRPRRADQLSATERNIRTIAGLTGRDREPERDPEHIDGTAVRVD